MTTEKDIFLNMDPTFNSKVKVGNGVVVEEKGECSIGVETKKERKNVIGDVLLVPELNQNLLSAGQLLDHG